MTLRAAIALVVVALAAAAPGSAAAPVENPVDGVLIGDVFLQHDPAPTASLSVVRADCDPDGVSTVAFHATGVAAQHGDADAGTFAVDATATIGPQRFPNFAEDNLDAGRLLSFSATVTLQLGAATVVTTETLWEPGARPGRPLPEQLVPPPQLRLLQRRPAAST